MAAQLFSGARAIGCLQVVYNPESARSHNHDDKEFMSVYEKAPPILQCMMDLAQLNGSRRGMLLRLKLNDVTDEGLWFTLNKQKVIPGKKTCGAARSCQ